MTHPVVQLIGSMPATARWVGRIAVVTVVAYASVGLAQSPTAPITSSGLKTHISDPMPVDGKTQYNITGGTRVGSNLFHSFGDFDIPINDVANFLNTPVDGALPSTSNILGRVTGGTPSSIFGTIQTAQFGSANLFLINPSGIILGPTASLNVGGSVTFTTADYLRLDKLDGPNAGIFHADPAQASLLSSAPIDAFGFLQTNPGAIAIEGSQLVVAVKQEITLVGGNISIQNGMLADGTTQPARLIAPNGKINMASAQSPGEFLRNFMNEMNINDQFFSSIGYIRLTSGSIVDIGRTGNGKVSIRGGQLVLEIHNSVLSTINHTTSTPLIPGQDTIVLAPTSRISSGTVSGSTGPDIHLHADQIRIMGVPSSKENFGQKPPTMIQSYASGTGKAGNIVLWATKDIELTKLVALSSITQASGDAGNIEVTSTHGNIRMTEGGKESRGVSSVSINSGDTGNVTVSAAEGNILLSGVPIVTQTRPINPLDPKQLAAATGMTGQVEIIAKNLEMKASTLGNFTTGAEQPGGIRVNLSGTLTMTADSSLDLPNGNLPDSIIVSTSVSRAPSGDITLTANDIGLSQKSVINNASFSSGPGGNLNIVADKLKVTDGSQLSSGSTTTPNRGSLRAFFQGISPTGPGGNITIQGHAGPTDSVVIDGAKSGIFADTEGTGAGGTISLSARAITLQNGGTISASTTGTDSRATGGSINITATDQVTLTGGASITARSTGPADAGTISINAGQQLDLMGKSSITTESKQASGGNINLQATDRIRLLDSTLSASVSDGPGGGGNILIDPKLVLLQNSTVLAQADQGAGGRIAIRADSFVADANTVVNADAGRGLNGTVTIQSPTSNISGTVGQLVSKTSPQQVLLQNRCIALAGGEQSTFLLAGRDALPTEPGGWLGSPISMEHWTGDDTKHASGLMVRKTEAKRLPSIAAHKNDPTILSLRRLTPPGFLVRAFATGSTGCPS